MRVAFRLDASVEIGHGHLMRCLALADAAAAAGAETCVVSRSASQSVKRAVARGGHRHVVLSGHAAGGGTPHAAGLGGGEREDAAETRDALGDGWDWIVVDQYAIGAEWESAMRGSGRVLVIDDLADRRHDCDALLDQNLYTDMEARYRPLVPSGALLLLGPRFALLRPGFAECHRRAQERTGAVARVLVAFGGTDPENNTGHSVEALGGIPGIGVDVVIGDAHAHRPAIEQQCVRLGFACHVQTDRMAELMLAADLAIGAGGITTWERCAVGLPALVFPVVDNQRRQVRDAALEGVVWAPDADGAGIDAATIRQHALALLGNSAARRAMSRRGLSLVDGEGVSRVVRRLGWSPTQLRPATMADATNLLEWRNHPRTRAASPQHEPIALQDHLRWLQAVLSSPDRMLLIGERDGRPVGVVRFDVADEEAEVSIHLVPGGGAPGDGTVLLRLAEQRLAAARPALRGFRARVLGDNRPSHGLFRSTGYAVAETWYRKPLGS